MVIFREERDAEYPRYSKRVVESYRQTGIERGMETADLVYGLDPEFVELYMQYTRGGMYAREVVPQSTREICACAALATLDKQAQLKDHLICGEILGATKEQLLEAVIQSVTYGGLPATIQSLKTYADVFPDRVKHDRPAIPASEGEAPNGSRFAPAVETARKLYGEAYATNIFERYDRWDPAFSQLAQRFVFGGTYAREVVDPGLRELIAIGCLTVRNAVPQLESHIRVGFRIGLERTAMQEIILQMTVYCGYPYVMSAMAAFERIADQQASSE